MDNELSIFYQNLRYLRKSKNLTQKEMAQLLHISVGYVRRLEHGELPPRLSINVLGRIHRKFGILPSTLVGTPLDPNWQPVP